VPAAISVIRQYSDSGFIEFSTTGYAYARVHELTQPGQLQSLELAVASSPRFEVWYRAPDVRIYRLRG
jgi:hypothetical protein